MTDTYTVKFSIYCIRII